MARDYVIRRCASIDETVDAERYLARTVHEAEELIDIGVLDAAGNKIMARQKMDPIGFVRFTSQRES
jgi:hypothetical protein